MITRSNRNSRRLMSQSQRHRLIRRVNQSRRLGLVEKFRDLAADVNEHFCVCKLDKMTLVTTRRPIDDLPKWVQEFLVWIFNKFRWCASDDGDNPKDNYYSIHYRGLVIDAAEGRHIASEAGASVTVLPVVGEGRKYTDLLPPEPCQFVCHDFPLSRFSHVYRNERNDFVTLTRQEFAMLGRQIEEVENCAAGQCKQ